MGFGDDVTKWGEKQKRRVRTIRKKIVFGAFTRVIMRTPVLTGRARGNWQATVGTPAGGTIEEFDKSGMSTMAKVNGLRLEDDQPAFLTNNLPYIEKLEKGTSQQAPAGMVGVTVAEFHGMAEKIMKETQNGE